MDKVLILIYIFCSCLTSHGFLNINSKIELNEKEVELIETFKKDLQVVLPKTIINSIERENLTISLKNQPLEASHRFASLYSPFFRHPELILNPSEIKKISNIPSFGKNSYWNLNSTGKDLALLKYKTYYNYYLAQLIHAIAHFYDQGTNDVFESADKILLCIEEKNGTSYPPSSGYQTNECRRYLSMNTSVSSHPLFLNATGYAEQGFFSEVNSYRRSNYLPIRNLNQLEWQNPKENFAVNLEFFLLDADFRCRKPTLYNILSFILQTKPFQNHLCKSSNMVFVSPNSVANSPAYFTKINFSRVYAIHYLFAGKGQEAISQFGHSMLRIVMCSPSRKVVDEKCLLDISHHLVISFRAVVTDLQMISMSGIKGLYPSNEFIFPMSSVISEYTKGELRWIKSLPLALSSMEMHSLLQTIIETQWTYEGKYKFFTNNCADETLQLLKRGLPFNPLIQELTISRPDTLFQNLIEAGLGKDQTLNKNAISKGYYFPTMNKVYEKSFDHLRQKLELNKHMTLEDYFLMPANERNKVIMNFINSKSSEKELLLKDFLLLEGKIADNIEIKRSSMILQTVHQKSEKNKATIELYDDTQNPINENFIANQLKKMTVLMQSPAYFTQMFKIDESGYGMFSPENMETLIDNFYKSQIIKSLQCGMKKVDNVMHTFLSNELNEEYEITKTNLHTLNLQVQQFLTVDFKIPTNFTEKVKVTDCIQ